MKSIILPLTRWAIRSPIASSGKTTCCTPIRSRIRPCFGVIAFAQTSGTRRSTSASAINRLASTSPMPITARGKSATPSWLSTSSLVASASTTWVSWSAYHSTVCGSASIASTAWPSRSSDSATCPPKRPSPITTVSPLVSLSCLANDRTLLREAVQLMPAAQGQRGGRGHRSGPAQVHDHDQHQLGGYRQLRRDPDGGADRSERRHRIEHYGVQRLVGGDQQGERTEGRHRDAEQRHRQRLP